MTCFIVHGTKTKIHTINNSVPVFLTALCNTIKFERRLKLGKALDWYIEHGYLGRRSERIKAVDSLRNCGQMMKKRYIS